MLKRETTGPQLELQSEDLSYLEFGTAEHADGMYE